MSNAVWLKDTRRFRQLNCFRELNEVVLHTSVRFASKQDAEAAILSTHLRKVNGHTAKCAWSRRSVSTDPEPATAKAHGSLGCGLLRYPATATLGTISSYPRIADRGTAAAVAGAGAGEQAVLCSCQMTATWPTYCGDANSCAVARCPSMVAHHSLAGPVISSSPYYVWVTPHLAITLRLLRINYMDSQV